MQNGHLLQQTSASSHQHGLESTTAARETSLAHSHSRERQRPPSGDRVVAEGLGRYETDIPVLLRTETRVNGSMTHGRTEATGRVALGIRTLTLSVASLAL